MAMTVIRVIRVNGRHEFLLVARNPKTARDCRWTLLG
jgi:hypothetical protein